jgi:hypothetical protein
MGVRVSALATLLLAFLLAVAACGGDDGSPTATVTPTPTPTSTKETMPPTRTPGEVVPPRELAGIQFYTWDSWTAAGFGGCPSQSLEGPFLGPAVFSVSRDDLSDIPLLPGYDVGEIRMCKLGGSTVLLAPASTLPIEFVAGPPRWASLVPLDALRVVSTAVGDVVVAPEPTEFPGGSGATAVRIAPFGLVVAHGGSEEDVVSAVVSVDTTGVHIPLGQDIFTGDINGIHFESEFSPAAGAECTYAWDGFVGGEPEIALSDTRVAIEPSYLPLSATPQTTVAYMRCDDVEFAEIGYYFPGGVYPNDQYWIGRKSGKPEWFSGFAEDWYTQTSVAGLPAVLVSAPPGIESDSGAGLYVREAFGMTAIHGPDPAELVKIAEGLNR